MNVQQAKDLLKENGYFVDNLWTVNDVKDKFNCTDDQAQYVLEQSLTNEATMSQIWFSIDEFGEMENLQKVIKDMNSDIINLGDSVEVGEPSDGDAHRFSFVGVVVKLNSETQSVSVEDQDNDCFTIDGDRLTIQ